MRKEKTMQEATKWDRRFFGISRGELVLVVLFYLVFGLAYYMVIYTTSSGQSEFIWQVILDYILKALLTIPIWWLMIKKWRHLSIMQIILAHLLLLPLFVFTWINLYYALCDAMGLWHLGGPGSGWDVYIPALFYVLQFGIFHGYDYQRRLQQQIAKEAYLREAALKSELSALKAQLNPHFLHNTFNTISASVPRELENTRELIATLADMFRYQLQASRQELVLLHEEVDFARKYLQLEKARFGDRLQIDIEVDPEIGDAAIPPMILQPIVENAIKHGISPKIEGGSVAIRIVKQGDQIHFEIRDTGVGLPAEPPREGQGIGLGNTRRRLEKMFGTVLQVINLPEGGVAVNFKIPLLA